MLCAMQLFFALVKQSFQRHLTYRTATIVGFMTNLFFGLVRVALMTGLYQVQTSVSGITLEEAITFAGLTQGLIAYLNIFGSYEVMSSVYTGEIGSDLLKPVNYFIFWLAQDIGRAMVYLPLRGVTMMGAYAVLFGIILPDTAGQWFAFCISLVFGLLVSFSWRFLVNLSAFWTPYAVGVGRFAFGISWVMSGFFLPLRFYPDWFAYLCYLTPFPTSVNTVTEIYLGLLSGWAVWQGIGIQVLWVVILTVIAQILLKAGLRRLVILGG